MNITQRTPGQPLPGETVYVESDDGYDTISLAEQPDPDCEHASGMGFDHASYFIGAVCRKCGGQFFWSDSRTEDDTDD